MKVIIYKNNDGGVSEVYPSPDSLIKYGIYAIALKDVPYNLPFKIIDSNELPDYKFRNEWVVDNTDLTDGKGAESNEFN